MQDPKLNSPKQVWFNYWWSGPSLYGIFEVIIGLLIIYLSRPSHFIVLLTLSGAAAAIANGFAYRSYRYVEFASPYEIIDPVPGVFWMVCSAYTRSRLRSTRVFCQLLIIIYNLSDTRHLDHLLWLLRGYQPYGTPPPPYVVHVGVLDLHTHRRYWASCVHCLLRQLSRLSRHQHQTACRALQHHASRRSCGRTVLVSEFPPEQPFPQPRSGEVVQAQSPGRKHFPSTVSRPRIPQYALGPARSFADDRLCSQKRARWRMDICREDKPVLVPHRLPICSSSHVSVHLLSCATPIPSNTLLTLVAIALGPIIWLQNGSAGVRQRGGLAAW